MRIENESDAFVARREMDLLGCEVSKILVTAKVEPEFQKLTEQLLEVNERLWDVEDELRAIEAETIGQGTNRLDWLDDGLEFDDLPDTDDRDKLRQFIRLARSVYELNDRRARLKMQIDKLLGSDMQEVKSYVN
jgi:hypothetical protein